MADTTKTTPDASRTASPQSAAAQKASTPGSEQMPGRQESPQFATHAGGQSAAAEMRGYESGVQQAHQESFGKSGEMSDMVGQAKQTVHDAYQQASRSVNETLEHAKEYSRENPGAATLVAFGVGVGVGVLLTSGALRSGRSRSQRLVPPVMNALSEIAGELFRR